jgi:hypothetical protein
MRERTMSDAEKKKEDKFIDEMVESMQDYKTPRHYDADDVDARIQFYDEHKTLRKSPEWVKDLYYKSRIGVFRRWCFIFCFGDMNEDFRGKIKRLEGEQHVNKE